MGKIPQEKIDTVCNYLKSRFDDCKTAEEIIAHTDTIEFQIAWKGSKHILAVTEEFFYFQDSQNIIQSLDHLGLVEHFEILDKIKVVWKKNHALLEEYY